MVDRNLEQNRRQTAAMHKEEEERTIEQADILAEWISIYHQTVNPDDHAGEDQDLYRIREEKRDATPEEEPEVQKEEEVKAPRSPWTYENL